MKIPVTAVYADLPLATTEKVELDLWDKDAATHLVFLVINFKKGKLKNPFVKITLTEQDMPKIKAQGISTEGLTHFIYEIQREGTTK